MEEYRQFTGEIKVLERRNEWLYDVDVYMLSASDNRNGWRYPVNESVAKLFLGKPLLTAYEANGAVIGGGHTFREFTDPETGEPRADFTAADAERIVGSLSERPEDIRVVPKDGDTWIVGRGTLWEWYCGQLCEQIRDLAEQGRTMPVSIETLVTKSHMDGEIEVMDEFVVLGVTILGIHVAPAVAGARITALRALDGQFNELKLRAASFVGEQNPAQPGTSEPNPEPNPVGEPTKNNNEGGNRTLILNRKQLATLNKRFQAYVVLAASKDDETGETIVKLRNDAFDAFTYKMNDENETVAPERIVPANLSVDLGDDLRIDAADLFDAMQGQYTRLNAEKERLEKELETAKEAIKKMATAEQTRRVTAAKNAAKAALDAFNADLEADEKVCEDDIACVMEAADNGEYTECADKEGAWCGEAKACQAVNAICAEKYAAYRKAHAEKKNNQYVWDGLNAPDHDDGSVGALLRSLNIQ